MKVIFLFLPIFLFSNCAKKVEKEHHEFIGEWHTISTSGSSNNAKLFHMNIDDNSNVKYSEIYDGTTRTTIKGKARATENKLHINRFLFFNIVEYPHLIDTNIEKIHICPLYVDPKPANWKMELSELKPPLYLNGNKVFYKIDY